MGTELGLELAHLVELLGREFGPQSIDRLGKILGALAAGNRVIGEALRE
jgi:hypothetical protein